MKASSANCVESRITTVCNIFQLQTVGQRTLWRMDKLILRTLTQQPMAVLSPFTAILDTKRAVDLKQNASRVAAGVQMFPVLL